MRGGRGLLGSEWGNWSWGKGGTVRPWGSEERTGKVWGDSWGARGGEGGEGREIPWVGGAQGISRRRAEALSTAAAPRGQRRAARNPPTPEHPLGEAEAALGAPGLPGGAAAALNPARLPHGDRRRRRLGAQGDDDTARAGAGR